MTTIAPAGGGDRQRIGVLAIREIEGRGYLRAFADVQIGVFELIGCRVVQQPGQRAYVQLPQNEYARHGRSQFCPAVRIHDLELQHAVKAAVLSAWRDHQAGGLQGQRR